jgi:hypothetical protein
MENIDDLILSMTTREEEERAEALKRASQLNASKSKKKSRKQ